MRKVLYGNVIAGNFASERELVQSEILGIEKVNSVLHAITLRSRIKLKPFDEDTNSRELVNSFSSLQGEDNESIYDFEVIGSYHIVILLSVFEHETFRINSDLASLSIYPDREITKKILGFGYNDPIRFLTDDFLQNRSLIISLSKTKRLSIYGQKYRGDLIQERPGIFRIFNLVYNSRKGDIGSVRQVFGKIDFITLEASLSKDSQALDIENIDTDLIFTVWDLYTDFLEEEFDKEIMDRGFFVYESVSFLSEDRIRLTFNLPNPNRASLFNGGMDDEYEVVVFEREDQFKDIKRVEDILDNPQHIKSRTNIGRIERVFENSIVFQSSRKIGQVNPKGCVLLSSQGQKIERNRRKKTIEKMKQSSKPTLRTMRSLIGNSRFSDTQLGTSYAPITSRTLFTMFGDINFEINENFREAINIAVNTPDFALIQGPPGTGKTTLIKGIVGRLSEIYKNVRILVSSEQHEALYNVVEKLSDNNQIPPYIISKQRNSDSKRTEKLFIDNVIDFQNGLLDLTHSLKESNDSNNNSKKSLIGLSNHFLSIRVNNYDPEKIKNSINEIKRILIDLGIFHEYRDILDKVYDCIMSLETNFQFEQSPELMIMRRRIDNQRLTLTQFTDDGPTQLRMLQDSLRIGNRFDLLIDPELEKLLLSRDDTIIEAKIPEFCQYVTRIKEQITLSTNSESYFRSELKKAIQFLELNIAHTLSKRPQTFSDVMDEFELISGDLSNCMNTVRKYSKIIASTCAQAKSYKKIANTTEEFDYVIIDEAARANPVDIMIPMLFASKVILVGDQAQLPQFVDNTKVDRFNKLKEDDYTKYLTKSLFSMLYDEAEKTWKDGRISFKRHVQIEEQHRMHPVIGEFISKSFYDSKVSHGSRTIENINDYNIFEGKNIAWVDLSNLEEHEKKEESYYRLAEVKTTLDVLKEIFQKNPNRTMRIGVISYYKRQVKLLKDAISDELADYMQDQIDCNTVDSFQGKEFDIVLLSTVRSNTFTTAEASIGFIHHSRNRVNVSLSRARKLLVVIGDASTFTRNPIFRNFISYVKETGYYESKSR